MTQGWKEFRVSDDAKHDPVELRRRMADEGYLFFKRLLNPDPMISLRRDIMGILQGSGWLAAGTDPMEGIAEVSRRCTEGDPPYGPVYHTVYRLESFHRLPHEPDLVSMVEKLMDARTIPVPGHKARIWFPRFKEHTTPTHQDFVHYQGSLQAITCWTPVGDCPIELGPLAVLPRSHTVRKVLPHHFSLGAGGLIVRLEEEIRSFPQLDVSWHTTNFEAGDVLFFPALTVHRALPNTSEDRLRVSLDNRYQREGDRIAAHMLQPHLSDQYPLTWEEVYQDWQSDDLKYYWRRIKHREVPRYAGYARRGFDEAVELARRGDEKALLAMHRTVSGHASTDEARIARRVIEEIGAAR
jgi:hypothetical protein